MIRLLDSQIDLDPTERRTYQSQWQDLLSENAPFRVLDKNGSLISAPITFFDDLLLSCASDDWRKMGWIVGEALASFLDDGVHQTGDLVLSGRIGALAENGAFEWRGDLSSMRDCTLRLPPVASR